MPVDSRPQLPPDTVLAPAKPDDATGIAAAVTIGNKSRKTLGHLPFAVYEDAARKGTLLLARRNGQVIAYALYGLTAEHVRLTHLCVDEGYRRAGLARQLVDFIRKRHADYPGIRARCRHDYGLGEVWIKLGFTQLSEKPGRSKQGHILVYWWLDHGHPNLLRRHYEQTPVRAAVDLNVVRALAEPNRPDAADAQALLDDQVSDRLELVRTAALDAEIDSIDGVLRGRCIEHARPMTSIHDDTGRASEVMTALTDAAASVVKGYPVTARDRFDLRHVSDAIAAGVNVFITSDRDLMRVLGPVCSQHFALRIMTPVDVITHLDELSRAEAYRPAALMGTAYSARLLGAGEAEVAQQLADTSGGERPRAFEALLHDLARQKRDRTGIFGPDGELVAIYSAYTHDNQLIVPVARVAAHPLSATLARQILFQLRQQARNLMTQAIRITDSHTGSAVRLAALNDGFQPAARELLGYSLDICGTAAQVGDLAVRAARGARQPEPPLLRSAMPAVPAAEIERMWWPAKLIDSQIPCYMIPIQQRYSRDLLGVPETVDSRPNALGLSREHVYYRSPRGLRMDSPARVLWYMSEGGRSAYLQAAVVACSQLDSVSTDTPDGLYERFRHLGVWTKALIEAAAHDGQSQAVSFSNTEIFDTAVTRERVRTLAEAFGGWSPPLGPQKISPQLFAAIYQAGQSSP